MADVALIDTLRSIDFSSITNSYQALGSSFEHPIHITIFTNDTDANMLLTLDPTEDQMILPAGGFKLFDLTTNRADYNANWTFAKGTQFYIKYQAAPTSGKVYIEGIYQRGK